MFTLNDLKNPTINIAQIYSDKIKVYDEIIETFPFNFIAIHLNKITNKLSLDIKNSNETWRKILTVDVSPELAESFKAYSRYYVAVAQRFNLLFLLHFLIFYVRKVRIVNDKTKINFGKCA